MGIALAAMLYPVVNQTLWRTLDDRPALEWRSFGMLIGMIVIVNLLILTDSLVVLYPIAYLDALDTYLLVIVFAILWVMIMKQDNTLDQVHLNSALPLTAGLTLALLMVLSIDLVRLQLTGAAGAACPGSPARKQNLHQTRI